MLVVKYTDLTNNAVLATSSTTTTITLTITTILYYE